MQNPDATPTPAHDQPPGQADHGPVARNSYNIGLGLAVLLTLASFWAASTTAVYPSAVPVLLAVLAVAQMGVHLVFFLHISSAPDQTNNILALAFGIFAVALIVFGTMFIMANLTHMMMPMDRMIEMQH
jgi:cytochrome o ubiquinol oxidase operon protein cyoD